MKWWKPLLILLLCATPASAGFWSSFPGVGPGTVLTGIIIQDSTINDSILNNPNIFDPTFNGTLTFNPGTVVNYDPSTIINGPNGSVWNYNGIYNLKNLTIAVGGSITLPPGSILNLPDGSVWTDQGLSTLNLQAGGVITIGGVPAGGACAANQYFIALSSGLVPTCAPITSIPGPVTINNPTFTGVVTGPDGGTWTSTGLTVTAINITGAPPNLFFNGVPMGGQCAAGDFVNSISSTGIPGCSTPAGGGGGTGPPLPLSVGNGGLGQGTAPVAGQILVAQAGGTMYSPVSMTGDATINTAGVVTVVSAGGKPIQPLTSTLVTAPTNPVIGQLWFDPTTLQTYIWYDDGTSKQWVAVVNIGTALANQTFNNPTFSGTVTFPDNSTWTSTALTINSPTTFNSTVNFTGTLTFPDGSYYDTNGHEVMKNLGVGMVAQTAGVGGVSGGSIVVKDSGWIPNAGGPSLNGYWDATGLNKMYEVDTAYVDALVAVPPRPTDPNFAEILVQTNPNDVTLDYPFGEYTLQNYGAPPVPDTGQTQTWQSEGLETINALGIHMVTWESAWGCNGTTINGADLSDCAVAAVTSSLNNNINYKMQVFNQGTGNAAQASYMLRNNAPHTGGMYLTGTGFTPAGGALADQLDINTNAANGVAVTIGYTKSVVQITSGGMNVTGALTVNGSSIGTGPWLPVNNPTFTGTLSGPNQVNTGDLDSLTWQFPNEGLQAAFSLGYGNTSETSFLIGQSMSYNAGYPNSWTLGGTTQYGPTAATSLQFFGAATVITGDTGLVTGQHFTPTMLFSISPVEYDGAINIMGNHIVPAAATFWVPLLLPNNTSASIDWGSSTKPTASMASVGNDNINLSAGSHYNGTSWIADSTVAQIISLFPSGIQFTVDTGLTAGNAYGPNMRAIIDSTGLNVVGNGTVTALAVNSHPVITNQVAFSANIIGQAGGSCTASTNQGFASRVGNHVIVQLTYQGSCTALYGWMQISGFPWHNTNNTYSFCTIETGGMPFDTNFWIADCRMLPNWDGCIPVEINSNAMPQYYNSALVPPGQNMLVNMTCSYLTDTMSP